MKKMTFGYDRGHPARLLELYAHFVQPGDLVFDVGANIGSRTAAFAELGARVIAVEPQKECVRQLYVLFHENPHVTIVPQAVGAQSGLAEMSISPNWNPSSSFSAVYRESMSKHSTFHKIVWTETRTVRMTTLDALIARFGVPTFTKIDVEGYEAQVLKGVSGPLPVLSFEFVPHLFQLARESIAQLERLGTYRYNYGIEEQMKLVLDEWVSADEMLGILETYGRANKILFGDVYARQSGAV